MNKRQNAKLNMYLAVLLVLNANTLVWNVLAVFVTAFNRFKAKLLALQAAVQRQADLIAGYAIEKREKRLVMAELAFGIKSAIQSLASDTGNTPLYNSVRYALSQLISGSNNRNLTRCNIILEAAQENAAALIPYGVAATDITDLDDAIKAFEAVIANPKDRIAQRKAATQDIKDAIKAVDAALKTKLDKLMEHFRLSAPLFYKTYFNDRRIDDAKTNFTEIRVPLLNKENGQLLEGVVMKAKGSAKEYTVVSNSNGVADAKQISPEIYDLEFELPGFEKALKNSVEVSPGEKEQLTVEMVPFS